MGRKLSTGIVGSQSDIKLSDIDSSNFVSIQAPTDITTTYAVTMPPAIATGDNYALLSNTSGVLQWESPAPILATPSDNAEFYPTFNSATTGRFTTASVNADLKFNPSLSLLTVPSLSINGTTTLNEVTEILTVINDYGTTQSVNFSSGNIYQLNGLTGNYTFNWTNVPTTLNRTFALTHIIPQGATPRIPTTLQINSSVVTINWAGNVTPAGSPNRQNIVSFLIWYTGTFTCVAALGSY